jgi:uncharacterized membrane protein YbhN (UPF0104 family)
MKALKNKQYLLTVPFSLVLAFFLLRNIDLSSIKNSSIYPFYLFQALLVMGLSYSVRAYYYKITTRSCHLRVSDFLKVTAVYNFLSTIIPFSAGHYSYVHLLKRYFHVERMTSAGSLIIFHLFKGGIIFIMTLVALYYSRLDYSVDLAGFSFRKVVFALILLLLLLIVILLRNGKGKLKAHFFDLHRKFFHEIHSYSSIWFIGRLFLLNVINVGLAVIYFLLIFKSLGFDLPISHIILLLGLVNFSAMLPIHGYGRIGTQEGFMVSLLILLGYEQDYSIVMSFATHILELFFQACLAIVGYAGLVLGQSKICAEDAVKTTGRDAE